MKEVILNDNWSIRCVRLFLKIEITLAILSKSVYVPSLKQTSKILLKNLEITELAYLISTVSTFKVLAFLVFSFFLTLKIL